MTPELETPAAVEIETVEVQPLPEAASLSEHRAEFPGPVGRGQPPPSEEKPRHRAKSQTAGPDDVKQIAELTKRARAAEEAIPIERKAGESERVYQLRRRAEIAESRRDAAPVVEKQPEPAVVAVPPVRQAAAVSDFTEKEPTIEQFHDQPDPYSAHMRALVAYDARKAAFESQQTTTRTSAEDARNQWVKETQDANTTRILAHFSAHPDDKAAYDAHTKLPVADQITLTPVMRVALETHGQGPQFMLELIRHPEFADEQALLTNGQYAFDSEGRLNPAVAILQRRLLARVQAVKTGAAVPQPRKVVVAPRPPTPVRTVPQTPSEKPPSGESSSLRDHRTAYPGRR